MIRMTRGTTGWGSTDRSRSTRPARDVTTYWYGINTDPSSKNKITTSDGAAEIAQILPSKAGVNFVTAQAFDAAGNGSEIRTYQFRVKAGQPARATWQLDEAAGASEAKGSTPVRTLALHGGATPGAAGADGTAVQFNGTDGYASTDLSPVNTGGGFAAVSAWVKLDKIPTATADVALIPGNNAPGMELYYSTTYGWSFNQYKSDDAAGSLVRADQGDTSKVKAGTWTHLVGSYSTTTDLLQLFVDGQLAESVSYDAPWTARRGLLVGGKNFTGTPAPLPWRHRRSADLRQAAGPGRGRQAQGQAERRRPAARPSPSSTSTRRQMPPN